MVRTEEEKTKLLISSARDIALIVTLVNVAVFLCFPNPESYGIYSGCPAGNRFAYSFFHASSIHLMLNAWCFLSAVFFFPVRMWSIILAFIIAFSFPVDFLSFIGADLTSPTIGLSGVCFALMGDCSHFINGSKKRYHAYVMSFILLGFFFESVNQWIHLYCYIVGCTFGYNSIRET